MSISGVLPSIDADLAGLFDDLVSRSKADHAAEVSLDLRVWNAVAEAGVERLTSPNGAGATWLEAAHLLRASSAAGVVIPIAENDLMAGWAADITKLEPLGGISTLGFLSEGSTAQDVPWASSADHVVVVGAHLSEPWITRVSRDAFTVEPGRNLAGHSRDRVSIDFDMIERTPVSGATFDSLRLRAKLARLIQITGALERAVELSVEHALVRAQFGRAIARFQAVQHLAADAAGEAHLARTAVDVAVAQLLVDEWDIGLLESRVAVAASVVGHAVSVVIRNAHQIHGAIGTTIEHRLHRVTLPALAWRNEYGSVDHWDAVVDTLFNGGQSNCWESLVEAGASVLPSPTVTQ